MKSIFGLATSVLLLAVAMGQPTVKENIIQVATKNGLETLVSLLNKAGVASVFEGDDEFTVFAPSEEAFKALDPALLEGIKSNPELLTTLLMAHVVQGKRSSYSFSDGTTANALLNGYKLKFSINENMMEVNGAKIIIVDLPASNGVIHVINKVIIPQKEDEEMKEMDDMNLIEMLGMKGFPTMLALLYQAGMMVLLQGKEKFTIFVPTEEAIMGLDPYLLTELMMDTEMLKKVLMAHVVRGEVTSNDLYDGMGAETLLDGYKLMVSRKKSRARVNGANIILPDMKASNGIIHVIDRLIIPQQEATSGEEPEAEPEAEPEVKPDDEMEGDSKEMENDREGDDEDEDEDEDDDDDEDKM